MATPGATASPAGATRARVPCFLDVQGSLLSALEARVVVPLYAATALKDNALTVLNPPIQG
ncbi:MAG: CcdB family protein [Pseudomonadota bacterium]